MMNHVMIQAATLEAALEEAGRRFGVPADVIEHEQHNLLDEDDLLTSNIFEDDIEKDKETVSVKVWINDEFLAQHSKGMLVTLLEKMQCPAQVEAEFSGGMIQIKVEAGEDNNLLIGHRGETLESLEYFINRAISRGGLVPPPVLVDIQDYRQRRIKYLEDLALKKATRVARSKKDYELLPMKGHERKIIHAILAGFKGVKTFSMGLEDERHIVISASDEDPDPSQFVNEDKSDRRKGGQGGQGGRRGGQGGQGQGRGRQHQQRQGGGDRSAGTQQRRRSRTGQGQGQGRGGGGSQQRRKQDDRFFQSGRLTKMKDDLPDDIGNRLDREDRNI